MAEAFEAKFAGNKSINVEVNFSKGDAIKVPVNINSMDADVIAKKIADQLQLPEIDTTELAKENTVNGIKDFLAHLALSSRSVDGVYSVSDGISIAHLYGNQSECLAVTEIRDKDTGWVSNRGNFLSSLMSLFPNCRYFELGCSDVTTSIYTISQDTLPETTIVFRDLQTLKDIVYYGSNNQLFNTNVTIHVYGLKTSSQAASYYPSFHVPKVLFHDYERGSIRIGGTSSYTNPYQTYIYLGCKGDKTDTITLVNDSRYPNTVLNDVEIRNGACQNIKLLYCNGLTEENMINHILKRLKQDEEMCGSGVTIALGATNLAKLTSEEAVALLDSLTNTYGYTFA